MNKYAKNRLIWLIGIIVGIIILFAAISRKKQVDVTDLVINIEHLSDGEHDLIKEGDVKSVLNKAFDANFKGVSMSEVDIPRLERVVEEIPYVEDAEVYADALNRVSIKIKQREPLIRIIDKENEDYYLDKNGVQMKANDHFTPRVMVATGNIPPYAPDFKDLKKYLLKDLFKLALFIEKTAFFKALVEQIYVNNAGEFILIPKVGDQKILFGSIENMEDKLQRLEIFYKDAMAYQGFDKYAVINLKYKGQIVCKKK